MVIRGGRSDPVDGWRWRKAGASAAAAIVIDALVGEPPLSPHPVQAFGQLMEAHESRAYRDDRQTGMRHAAFGIGCGAAVGAVIPAAAATYLAVAGRALGAAAADVAAALDADDLDRARSLLPCLVGRDPSRLDAKEVARAAVESVAENTVDALVAPALWGALGGGAGALGYRALNTLDSRVGHHSERYEQYGWASARLDDAANWVPARITAALVAMVRPWHATAVWSVVTRDAPAHPSPNAGVAESAFAAALGLQLGGVNEYDGRVEVRPYLGQGRPAETHDIIAAVRLSRHVGLALAAGLATPATLRALTRQRMRRA